MKEVTSVVLQTPPDSWRIAKASGDVGEVYEPTAVQLSSAAHEIALS
jgi:hypothetical protein